MFFKQHGISYELSLRQKLVHMNWGLVLLIICIASTGILALYSSANGNMHPWASTQLKRMIVCLSLMFLIAVVDIRFWHRIAYLTYIGCLVLLLCVEFMGQVGMGAQRWIDIGGVQIQPSELMKIAMIMILARYFHAVGEENANNIMLLFWPLLLAGIPIFLVSIQPDLGTAIMLTVNAGAMFFIGGAPLWIFIGVIILGAGSVPVVWQFLHDYQKDRILTFLNPESDPLGAGYHILQSKIALGSGGIDGKGFLQGTQSHLNFLPEKQTDFIFTLWAEEWGLFGGLFILLLMGLVILYGHIISYRSVSKFSKLLVMGLTINFSLYVMVNIAMVMGVIPVVGAPLPLVSYGGTSMLAVMAGFGLVLSASIHRDAKVPRI